MLSEWYKKETLAAALISEGWIPGKGRESKERPLTAESMLNI